MKGKRINRSTPKIRTNIEIDTFLNITLLGLDKILKLTNL